MQELVWKSVGLMVGQTYTDVPVVFEDVHFHRATTIPKEGMYNSTVHFC
jgi:fatty acid synthase